MSRSVAKKSPGSRTSSRTLFIAVACGVLAAGGYGFKAWREVADAAAARERVLAEVATAVARQPIDTGELSRCTGDLQRLPEHGSDPWLLMAQASIELARDRAERAEALFGAVGGRPDAPAAQQRLVASILLRRQEGDLGERAASVLRQVIELSLAGYAEGREAGDLLRAWQAAVRLPDDAQAAVFAEQLAREQAETAAGRFVQFATQFDPQAGVAAVAAAVEGLRPEPVEAMAMRVMATLQLGDVPAATAACEAALSHAPGVFTVRWAAFVVFHACALGSAADSPERASWLQRRDAQCDWLLAQPGLSAKRREQCLQLREQR